MEAPHILSAAAAIARDARAEADRAQIQANVEAAERSSVPVLRSLAAAYRMLQFPQR